MASFILRRIDRDLWIDVRRHLAPDAYSKITGLIESLLRDWLRSTDTHAVSVQPKQDRRQAP